MKAFSLALAGGVAIALSASAVEVKIDRCEPVSIKQGTSTEVRLHGRNLETAALWASFPAKIERVEGKEPRFRITTEFVGTGALRAHSDRGASDLFFLAITGDNVIGSENKQRREDAQEIPFPSVVSGSSPKNAANFFRFAAKGGQRFEIAAEAVGSDFDGVLTLRSAVGNKRVAFADDSEAHGADPWLAFVPPEDGEYVIEVSDSEYRGGLAFQLRIGEMIGGFPITIPSFPSHDESTEDPFALTLPELVYGAIDHRGDQDAFRFPVKAGSFLTIMPMTRSIGTSVTMRMKLTAADGSVLAETPTDAFDERPLRLKIAEDKECLLRVEDAFGRFGDSHVYGLKLRTDEAPFELTIPGERDRNKPFHDRFVAVSGGEFTIPVRCHRHQFGEAIALSVDGELDAKPQEIAAGKGDASFRVRVPTSARAGQLIAFGISGKAQSFEAPLKTSGVLRERFSGASIPGAVDETLAVRVLATPLTIESTVPEALERDKPVKIPVKLTWKDEGRKFNTNLRIIGLPEGVNAPDRNLNNKETATEFEIKPHEKLRGEMKDLQIEVRVDFYRQPLLVRSDPFTIRIPEPENNDA